MKVLSFFINMIKLTKNREKIIIFLGDHPEEEFFGSEIASKLKISLGGVHGALKFLVKEKLVDVLQKGNMKFYQIVDNNPFVRQFKSAVVTKKLLPVVDKIKNISHEIILFGSAARGEQTAESDVDLFVLTDNVGGIEGAIKKDALKMKINSVIKTPSQWSEMEIKDPEFYNEVKQGIKLFSNL